MTRWGWVCMAVLLWGGCGSRVKASTNHANRVAPPGGKTADGTVVAPPPTATPKLRLPKIDEWRPTAPIHSVEGLASNRRRGAAYYISRGRARLREAKAAKGSSRERALSRARYMALYALENDHDSPEAVSILAQSYLGRGWQESARQLLEQAVLLPSGVKSAELWMLLGIVRESSQEFTLAATAFERAALLKSDYAKAWMNLGALRLRLRQFPQAVEALKRARKYDVGSQRIVTNLGTAYRRLASNASRGSRDYKKYMRLAEKHYETAIRSNKFPPAHYNLALLYLDADGMGMGKRTALRAAIRNFEEYRKRAGIANVPVDEHIKSAQAQLERLEKADEERRRGR